MTVYIVSELMHVELILCDIRREVSAYPIGIRYINKVPECNTIFLSFGIVGCERCSVQVIHPVCTYYRVVVLVVEMSYRRLGELPGVPSDAFPEASGEVVIKIELPQPYPLGKLEAFRTSDNPICKYSSSSRVTAKQGAKSHSRCCYI